MRIENFFTQIPSSDSRISSGKEEKTKIVAREVLSSLPTIGTDPVITTVLVGIGAFLLGVLVKTGEKVADTTAEKLEKIIYPNDEKDPFKMKSCLEAYPHGRWFQSDPRKQKLPNPVFDPNISEVIERLRRAPQNALDSNTILPSAIISGPWGVGKTTACEGIARGGNWNYFLLTGKQFIDLLKNEETSNRFFKDIRNEKLPTVFVVDEADNLVQSESDDVIEALQKFRALTSIRDHKMMFLFITKVALKDITDKAFLSRMTYQVAVKMPGSEELKKILLQQATRLLKQPVLDSFTPETCEYLANTVFKGKHGRDVQDALSTLSHQSTLISKTQLTNYFQGFFNEYRA